MKATNSTDFKGQHEQLPIQISGALKKLTLYDRQSFPKLSIMHLKSPLEVQVRKFQSKSRYSDEELLMVVLNNHVRAVLDLKQLNGNSVRGQDIISGRRSFSEKPGVQMYEQIAQQFFDNDQQLNKLIILNNDFQKSQALIEKAIQNYTARGYRFKRNKIIQSRVRILEIILSLLRYSNGEPLSQDISIPLAPQFKSKQYNNTSFKQLQHSHVRLIVEELDDKVRQLSTICEQIPQLQTYKRTLDLTMPEHNDNLTKIVDVLIQLHHRVNKLLSRKPEKLLKEIQNVENECLIIETATLQFIQAIESQANSPVKVIYFNQKKNKSPDYFRKIQKNVVKISQHLVAALSIQDQFQSRMVTIKGLLEVFWNLVAGMDEYEKQWKLQASRRDLSEDEAQIIQILEECLKIVEQQRQQYNCLKDEFEQYMRNQSAISAQNDSSLHYLEEEVNRLSKENDELRANIHDISSDRDSIKIQLTEIKKKYADVNRKHDSEQSLNKNKLANFQKKQKNYKDRIEALEAETEQKKIMINNITNDLKRAMRDSEMSRKFQQKNKELKDKIQKLVSQKDEIERKLRDSLQDNELIKKSQQLLEDNNSLLLHKLQQANNRINQLTNLKSSDEFTKSLQIERLQTQLSMMQEKVKDLQFDLKRRQNEDLNEKEMAEKSHQQILTKKQQKITQLNSKIIELNKKLNKMVEDYKNMEFQLKRRDQIQRDLTLKLKEVELQSKQFYGGKLQEYEKTQEDLSKALSEIESMRITVDKLQDEIKRRQQIIQQLQRIINDLEIKIQNFIENQKSLINEANRSNFIFKADSQKFTNEIERLRKEKDRYHQDTEKRIRELQAIAKSSSINDHRVTSLEAELRSKKTQISDLQNDMRALQKKLNDKLRDKESELINAKRELQNKIYQLENDLREKVRKIQEQENKIRDLGMQISNNQSSNTQVQKLQIELTNRNNELNKKFAIINELQKKIRSFEQQVKKLQNELRNKEFELKNLSNKANQNENEKHLKEIDYLKERIKNLQDIVDLLTNQCKVLEAKIKQYRLHEGSLRQQAKKADIYYQQLAKLKLQLSEKQKQYERLKTTRIDQSQIYVSPIHKNKLGEESVDRSVDKNKMDNMSDEINNLKQQIRQNQLRYRNEQNGWRQKERSQIQEIERLKIEIRTLQARVKTNPGQSDQSKYYSRVEGQKLEQFVSRLQNGNINLGQNLEQILANTRRVQTLNQSSYSSAPNPQIKQLLQSITILSNQVRNVLKERHQLMEIIKEYPNPEFLTQFVFKIILYFSQLHPESQEARSIWDQLILIRENNKGGQYFVVLEDFTKYVLQQNAIDIYRQQLRDKAKELEELKSKLDSFIENKLKSEEKVYNRTSLHESRSKLYREKYKGYTSSSKKSAYQQNQFTTP